ncbi:TIGR04282 family arsenosugar biosynthesis glycosyltransferase, partial [Dokdonella sp.]|uniref:TIGR04282 family arsenosugar biosynthesis glycosyltransferase n=1 Tax=Dokdonella sp. TaxID=2291710 RepID=UPI003C60530E
LYLASAAAVRSVVDRTRAQTELEGYWATAESDAGVASSWPGLRHVAQGEGGLGQRMAAVYRSLRATHGAAILIGADAPQIESRQLLAAARWLQTNRARLVIGRAADGGFWLFGGNTELSDDAWNRVDYSMPDTANDFVSAMSGSAEWKELEELQDIDFAADIAHVSDQLLALNNPTAEQSRVRQLLVEIGGATRRHE